MNTETNNLGKKLLEVVESIKSEKLEPLANHSKMSDVITKVNEIVDILNAKRDRGPVSTKTMTEEDARRCMTGDLVAVSHTKAAEALGLSYGQIYSARKGFTFKPIYQEVLKSKK